VVHQLGLWLERPRSCAFIFAGGTGTGKTSTAIALAAELGVAVEQGEFGGLAQLASGEQTGDGVRAAMRLLSYRALGGSGWRVLIVNEADHMTPGAGAVWLDALEDLPPRAIVVFTTNRLEKLPQRLRDRCEVMQFESSALLLGPDLDDFARRVWQAETGRGDCPSMDDLGFAPDAEGNASFRRVLQLLEPHVRDARAGRPFQKRLCG
jgi:replication-associated recombination protein RarA